MWQRGRDLNPCLLGMSQPRKPLLHPAIYRAFLSLAQDSEQPIGVSSLWRIFTTFIITNPPIPVLFQRCHMDTQVRISTYFACHFIKVSFLNRLCSHISYSTHLPVRQILTCSSSSIRATYYCFLYASGSLVGIRAFFDTTKIFYFAWTKWYTQRDSNSHLQRERLPT